MPTVCLSYSREDLLLVEQLEAHLKNHSEISIWRDQKEIHGGQTWLKVMGEAVCSVLALVVPVSKMVFILLDWSLPFRLSMIFDLVVVSATESS
jgi:hypothetical protein